MATSPCPKCGALHDAASPCPRTDPEEAATLILGSGVTPPPVPQAPSEAAPPPVPPSLPAAPPPVAAPSSKRGGWLLAAIGGGLAVAVFGGLLTRTDPETGEKKPLVKVPALFPTPTPPILRTYHTRRGAEFHIDPEEAAIAIDGTVIGTSDDWDDRGGGETYYFKGKGTHYVKITRGGYRSLWLKVVVDENAERKVVQIRHDMVRGSDS